MQKPLILRIFGQSQINFRKKRFELFKYLFLKRKNGIKILDVGGTEEFWKPYKFDLINCKITILNLVKIPVTVPNFKSLMGDARNMKMFKAKEFDVVFSNSVIEHVGDWEDQKKMAKEIQRVGKHYFIQTPNYYFPLEPHFLFPFFQYLPLGIKVFLIRHFNLGWRLKSTDYSKTLKEINSVKLLKKDELISLFPAAHILNENTLWLNKSFIVYN